MDNPSSQLDPYTPPNNYQIFYTSYKPSQQTKPKLELIFLVYHIFDDSSFKCVLVLIFLARIL